MERKILCHYLNIYQMFWEWVWVHPLVEGEYIEQWWKQTLQYRLNISTQMEISDVNDIFMTDKKGYITLNVIFKKEGKIMLRSSSGIQKWFSLIKVSHCLSSPWARDIYLLSPESGRQPRGGAQAARHQGLLVREAAGTRGRGQWHQQCRLLASWQTVLW